MAMYDEIYTNLVNEILNEGTWDKDQQVRTKWADGSPAHSKEIFGKQIKFNELPVPTTKKLAWKVAIKEMLLFWQYQTVKKEDFHSANVHVWDEWFLEDNTIGKSYAYQFESKPKKDVVLIKKKDIKYQNSFPTFTVTSHLQPNYSCDDEFVGKIFSSKNCGDFIILDVFKESGVPLRAKIQFLDTGYVTTTYKTEIKRGKISDPYCKNILGIAAYGDLSTIKNLSQEQIKQLYSKWNHMIHRCYNPKDSNYKVYGANGVKVHDRWLLFENYVRDIRYLTQWHLAKNDLDNWYLDKDYYESNLYSVDTCVWLNKVDNDTYRKQSKPFEVTTPTGEKFIALSTVEIASRFGLKSDSISRILNSKRGMTQTKGYSFQYVIPKEGYVYRYKLSKNQVNELISNIKNNPTSRRLMTSFWNYEDVEEKALQECAFQTQWRVQNGKLNLLLTQRSGDLGLGIPFNQFQYAILQRMIAQVCGLEVGEFTHHIGSLHIYERHMEPLQEQINRTQYDAPKLWINPEIHDFYDFTIDDVKLIDYKAHPNIKMEVAI